MNKICRGIQHTVVLKNIDRYNDSTTPSTQRNYRCVLTNLGSENSIYVDLVSTDWAEDSRIVEGKTVTDYYAKAIFAPSQTINLDDGKVSLAVYDKDTKEVLYYRKNYTKVFTTPII